MGLKLTGPDKGPIPRKVFLELTCDVEHAFFGAPTIKLDLDKVGGYIVARSMVRKKGWKISGEGRVFCPSCAPHSKEQEQAE
jgi:hypothetical protein